MNESIFTKELLNTINIDYLLQAIKHIWGLASFAFLIHLKSQNC